MPQASALVGARGADGWELVAMYNGVLCYKRPSLAGAPRPRPGAPAAERDWRAERPHQPLRPLVPRPRVLSRLATAR